MLISDDEQKKGAPGQNILALLSPAEKLFRLLQKRVD